MIGPFRRALGIRWEDRHTWIFCHRYFEWEGVTLFRMTLCPVMRCRMEAGKGGGDRLPLRYAPPSRIFDEAVWMVLWLGVVAGAGMAGMGWYQGKIAEGLPRLPVGDWRAPRGGQGKVR